MQLFYILLKSDNFLRDFTTYYIGEDNYGLSLFSCFYHLFLFSTICEYLVLSVSWMRSLID